MALVNKRLTFKRLILLASTTCFLLLIFHTFYTEEHISTFVYQSGHTVALLPQNTSNSAKTTFIPTTKRRNNTTGCVIPELNPMDPEIRPYIAEQRIEECPIRNLVKVEGDTLILRAENINDAGYRYIQRVDDFDVKLSGWNSMVKFTKKQIKKGM